MVGCPNHSFRIENQTSHPHHAIPPFHNWALGGRGHSMVERNGLWYTGMDSGPGSASDELRDLEPVIGSAELLFAYW